MSVLILNYELLIVPITFINLPSLIVNDKMINNKKHRNVSKII